MVISSVSDYRAAARRRLPPFLFDYIDGGAGAEETLRANEADLATIRRAILHSGPDSRVAKIEGGLSDPHVPGVEWGYGAMGNARWRGVRLKDVLERAGVKANDGKSACQCLNH